MEVAALEPQGISGLRDSKTCSFPHFVNEESGDEQVFVIFITSCKLKRLLPKPFLTLLWKLGVREFLERIV